LKTNFIPGKARKINSTKSIYMNKLASSALNLEIFLQRMLNSFQKAVVFLISFYQRLVSPLLPPNCRFCPSCSDYALQAVHRFGIVKGLILAIIRVLKCNPLFSGGYDPVPELDRPGRRKGENTD